MAQPGWAAQQVTLPKQCVVLSHSEAERMRSALVDRPEVRKDKEGQRRTARGG